MIACQPSLSVLVNLMPEIRRVWPPTLLFLLPGKRRPEGREAGVSSVVLETAWTRTGRNCVGDETLLPLISLESGSEAQERTQYK